MAYTTEAMSPRPGFLAATGVVMRRGVPRGKTDSFYVRRVVRWVSVPVTAVAHSFGMSANLVSVLSIPVAIASFFLLASPTVPMRVAGALLINVWLVLDCADGNLARINGPHAFGEF